MSLTKDHTTSFSFYGNMLEAGSSVQFPHISPYDFDNYIQNQDKDGLDSPTKSKNSPPLSSSSSANSSNGLGIHQHASSYDQPHEEAHSLINFKTGFESFYHSGRSLLSFQQAVDQTNNDTSYPKLSHSSDHHYQIWEGSNSSINQLQVRLLDQVNCLQRTSGGYKDATNEGFYAEAAVADPPQESGTQETCFNKRPPMEEEDMQAVKKQCTTSASKKPAKPKSSTSKDPQSIAAKNRRERISERLKILQDLVPNGSKIDLVTMLEKAISYVKFLQLQVEVLANDELWPAAGGKSLNISQVREAIDVILSSHRSESRA